MREDFLHYIWKNSDVVNTQYQADTGEVIKVIDEGIPNNDQGPDFLNAKIEIDGTLWAGTIEIHIDSADWYNHRHQDNPGYDNVILHVVDKITKPVKNSQGRAVPTIKLIYPNNLKEKYQLLINSNTPIRCAKELPDIDNFRIQFWISGLTIERIEQKTNLINQYLTCTSNNWNEAFYVGLARYFGMNVNAEPFEMLARSLPLLVISKHQQNIMQLEALLFGQAGLLPQEPKDEYSKKLVDEYKFLCHKYKLQPLDKHLWKFHRLRPMNFPTVRLSQFASLIHKSSHLFSKILESNTVEKLSKLFKCEASDYWQTHYQFGIESKKTKKAMGKGMIESLLINTIIPFIFIFGKKHSNEKLADKAMELLEALPAEKNKIISDWTELGFKCDNASISQSLIQLRKNYCDKRRCINCQIGHLILSKYE
ncbi:MAG: DUF2851 family protein [Bacteroidales bacterium]|nr:DUF2851 family protein [Bacteroidales bacterium]